MNEIYDFSFFLTKGLGRKTKQRLSAQFSTEEISTWDFFDYQKVLNEKDAFVKEAKKINFGVTSEEEWERIKESILVNEM